MFYFSFLLAILFFVTLSFDGANGFYLQSTTPRFQALKYGAFKMLADLETGDFQNVIFTNIDTSSSRSDTKKFKLEATIKSKDFNEYLKEYKEEIKRRKVVFPGFRPGKTIHRI